jgi:signal transduction histidine kinase
VADPLAPAAALAGTVAHDLGNLLTVILGNAELLIESLPDRPDVAELATLILAAAQRGTELTERLDRLARRVPVATEPTDLLAVITAFARRLAPELPSGIAFETSLPARAAPILMTPATVTLVLEELVGNALAALRGQGRLHIALMEDVAQRRIRVMVEDDGPGIAPETLRRIGEWRFTSGIAGHKTGVGLALVQRVAASCGGRLSIHPAPGGGTRVTLELAAPA